MVGPGSIRGCELLQPKGGRLLRSTALPHSWVSPDVHAAEHDEGLVLDDVEDAVGEPGHEGSADRLIHQRRGIRPVRRRPNRRLNLGDEEVAEAG